MKAAIILLVLLLMLGASCTPVPSPTAPATKFTPAVEPVPPASKDAAPSFLWTVDPGVRLEDATVPNIYRLGDGRFRLFFGGPGQSVHSVFSAISADGLRFEKEGIRIDSQQTPDRGWASVPEATVLPDGRVRLYYVSDGLDVKHGIVSAISEDGLNFTREETQLTGFVDPTVVRLANGTYLMLAVAFPFGPGGKLTDAEPGIYSFIAQDGMNFKDRKLVLAGEDNIDPAIVDLGDGAYRVYYWNAADKPPVIKSMSGKLASTPSPAATTTAPNITPVLGPKDIAGARVWLFAVDDGNPQLALSAESDGRLVMGRLDVTNPDATVSWQTIASPADTGGASIADHWHIFAHGYHWLVFSVAGDSASYLLKLDKDFRRLALVAIGHTDGPTNDMFLVAEPDGVAVAHFAPGYGHTIHRFDLQAKKIGQVRIGGGTFTHANGSSAIPVEGGYLVFATESLNPMTTSAVQIIQFDTSWHPVKIGAMLDENGTSAVMATAVRLNNGYIIVHLRIRSGVSARQKEPVAPQPGSMPSDDSGALVRLVLAPDGTTVSRETLVSGGANRPHTMLAGDRLVTTWDETGAIRLRVDRVQ